MQFRMLLSISNSLPEIHSIGLINRTRLILLIRLFKLEDHLDLTCSMNFPSLLSMRHCDMHGGSTIRQDPEQAFSITSKRDVYHSSVWGRENTDHSRCGSIVVGNGS